VDRPDIEWFTRRLGGLEGHAIKDLMIYTKTHVLIDYIKQLERDVHDRETMHQVRGDQTPK